MDKALNWTDQTTNMENKYGLAKSIARWPSTLSPVTVRSYKDTRKHWFPHLLERLDHCWSIHAGRSPIQHEISRQIIWGLLDVKSLLTRSHGLYVMYYISKQNTTANPFCAQVWDIPWREVWRAYLGGRHTVVIVTQSLSVRASVCRCERMSIRRCVDLSGCRSCWYISIRVCFRTNRWQLIVYTIHTHNYWLRCNTIRSLANVRLF